MMSFLLNLQRLQKAQPKATRPLLHSQDLPKLHCTGLKHSNGIVPEDLFMLYDTYIA